MTTSTVPDPVPAPRPASMDGLFGQLWPEPEPAARPRVVGAAVAVGLLAAVVLPFRDLGVGTFVTLVAVGATVVVTGRAPRSPYLWAVAGLCLSLSAVVMLRDAEWLSVLAVLAAFGLGCSALVDARTVAGLVASGSAVPLAALRGLPWLGRSVRAVGRVGSMWPALRTAAISLVLVAVFGALFVSADALFASWVDALLPDLSLGTSVLRLTVLVLVGGVTLAASYVALNPPHVDRLAPPEGTRVARAFEWLVPVCLLLALYVGFVAAQLTVMFGGHGYLRRTTGLTYAEHVHQGFGQLTVATVLTLGVVAVTARKAPRSSVRERVLLRGVLGGLCGLTLVVVASALFRMHVYEEAYGFTRLRVLVSVFEAWVGLVLLLVLVAGVRLRGRWVPRAAALSGAVTLLALAVVNPDGYVAERNVARYLETGKADWYYLAGLSADAVPALRQLPSRAEACVFGPPRESDDDWLEWNLGRARAGSATLDAGLGCLAR
ncbi:MAG: DUF4153 domain-containing protein [Nocardioidaceae bacterium]